MTDRVPKPVNRMLRLNLYVLMRELEERPWVAFCS